MLIDFALFTPMFVSLTWALILIMSSRLNRARLFLGIFMFTVSMIFLSHVIYYHHLKNIYLYFDLIFIFGSLSIFPIYYWYMKVLTFRSRIGIKDLKHLIPATVMVLATSIIYLLMNQNQKTLYLDEYLYGNGEWQSAPLLIKTQLTLCHILQLVYLIQIIFSFVKIRVFIKNYNDNIANYYSNLENKTLEWPKIILYTFVITSVFTIFTNFLGRSFFDKYPLILLFTGIEYCVFLYILGYLGHLQNHTVEIQEANIVITPVIETIIPTMQKTKIRLLKLFDDDELFKSKELNITDVANRLHSNRTNISALINKEFKCSFNSFVNQYRVKEAKKMLQNIDNNDLTIEQIASAVGFNSIDSFIRAFKEIESNTPGNFRKLAQRSKT